ncbi:MAG: ATP-binding cassette domain-containing protein [Liquorilactobacillus hordei]|uniref:ABC transporter ATP-binding protein n=1 Tax=Lactobacillaceae TaxID=33958 RepID=UPI0039E8B91A
MESILRIDNLNKVVHSKNILTNVSLSLDSGQVLGLVGPNGAGKTTLMRCVLGLTKYNSGDIKINNIDSNEKTKFPLKSVGSLIENPGIYPFLTGRENLKLYSKHLPNQKELDTLLMEFKMGSYLDRKVSGYSLGMKQKLGIVLALLGRPSLVILDEPMNGLDPLSLRQLRHVIADLAKQGTSFLISSHIISEMQRISDRIVVLANGKIISSFKTSELAQNRVISIKTSSNKLAESLLKKMGISAVLKENNLLFQMPKQEILAKALRSLITNDINIWNIGEQEVSLEDIIFDKLDN